MQRKRISGRFLRCLDTATILRRSPDGYLSRLQAFGHYTLQSYGQKAIFQRGVTNLYKIRQLELPFKGRCSYSSVQIFTGVAGRLGLTANGKLVLLRSDMDLVWRKSGHRQYDPIAIVIVAADVEGRMCFGAIATHLRFQPIEQPVKPNRRPPIGRKIKIISHFQILLLKQFGA
jgi:hypothetical protein